MIKADLRILISATDMGDDLDAARAELVGHLRTVAARIEASNDPCVAVSLTDDITGENIGWVRLEIGAAE